MRPEIGLYYVDVITINDHIQKIYADDELSEEPTIWNYRIFQTEGTRQVNRDESIIICRGSLLLDLK